jgi:two-component system sensor histidine kinase RstB
MFIRIYTSLLISVLMAVLLSYGFYSWQYQQRQENYFHSVFHGSFYLLNKGLQRHTGEKQQLWLQVMERLIGADIEQRTLFESVPSSLRFVALNGSKTEVIYQQGLREIRTIISGINEQHYRMMATLIRNELGRLAETEQVQDKIEALIPYFHGLTLIDIDQIELDPQQLSRLNRLDTVVVESGQFNTLIYSRLPNSDKALVIGPLAGFNPLPMSNMLIIMFLSLLITAASAYVLVYRLERRVKSIQYGVDEFSKAPAHLPSLNEDADVIGRLAWSINGMSLRIHQLLLDQKQIIQAISHELRTPMSRMKFRLQVLQDDQLSPPSLKSIAGINRDIDEVNMLIKEALDFDRGSLQHETSDVELDTLVIAIIENLKVEFSAVNINLQCVSKPCIIHQDIQQMKRLLKNLIENACKYGEGKVVITIDDQGHEYLISIDDNGSGIANDAKLSVFSPFTRLEGSRNKMTGGIGLGLAIAKNIADLAGITLLLSDSELGGACFSLVIVKSTHTRSTGTKEELE